MKLPAPCRFNGATRWSLSELEKFEAEAKGLPEPEPRTPESERYLSVKQVASRYDVSIPTVWRWSANAESAA